MPLKHTHNTPLILDRYYIVDLSNLLDPRLFPVVFISRAAASRAIRVCIPKNKRKHYSIVRGKRLKRLRYKYRFSLGVMSKFTKYTYPKDCIDRQSRKTHRTVMRRRLRRMGMLTLVKSKHHVEKPPQVIKLIQNTQKVAKSPNTTAKAFKLERKGEKYIYLILKKMLTSRRGLLFKVKCLRINLQTGKVKRVIQPIRRKDIINPLILREVYEQIEKTPRYRRVIKTISKKGFTLNKRKKG